MKAALKENTGIAMSSKKIQSVRSQEFDIGVKARGRRAYLHCLKTRIRGKECLVVISIGGSHG